MFSFVDQITHLDETSVRGRFGVPPHFDGAPDWLIVEAIGQLAAWAAMRNSGFSLRPVGATVGGLEFRGPRRCSGVLDLSATIDRTDHRAILYSGDVSCEDTPVATMQRCIGPLLPMEAFEEPEDARRRLEELVGPRPLHLWAREDPFPGEAVELTSQIEGDQIVAEFRVDEEAPLFREHFPLQPVVPASLLIGTMGTVAGAAAARSLGSSPDAIRLDRVRQVKVRRFTKPGECLTLEADVPAPGGEPELLVQARSGDEMVASVRIGWSSDS